MTKRIVVLGAEMQAATSIARAYPDRTLLFVSDQRILDGSDLDNVSMCRADPAGIDSVVSPDDEVVALSPRWLTADPAGSLSKVFESVERHFRGRMLPLLRSSAAGGSWILKGDRWHRPDAPMVGTAEQLSDATDPHGCGLVYQPYIQADGTIMVVGRRNRAIQLGCMRVLDERHFWDDILQAAETIDAPKIVDASGEVLEALEHRGFFTMNWVLTPDGPRLTSFRPVPKAVFQMFQRGGVDLFDEGAGSQVVRAGLRMIAMPTYVSYKGLDA